MSLKSKMLQCRPKNGGFRQGLVASALALVAVMVPALAQSPITYQYFYDAGGQLTGVVDSTGVQLTYTYDPAGNITAINKASVNGGLSIISFSPAQGGPGATVNIQGQGFSTTPSSNIVTFNGVAATVTAASSTNLTVTVPNTATTGVISVQVAAATANSASNFTVQASPLITSINPPYLLTGKTGLTVVVQGVNMSGVTFSVLPQTTPAALTITNIQTTSTSATLTITTGNNAANAIFVANNAAGSSTVFGNSTNTVAVLLPDADADGDGLTNQQEISTYGTNPLSAFTTGNGLPDGWQVHFGINPLDPTVAGKLSAANDGLTNLQEYLGGTDPTNTDRTVPAVTTVTPANGFANAFINTSVVLNFNKPILNNTQIAALQQILAKDVPGSVTFTAGTSVINGTAIFSGDGKQITFTPAQNLAITTTYTVTATGFRTLAGVPMAAQFTSTFTTNSQKDVTPPTVTRLSPFNGATGVPINASYAVQFSKPIDPSTLNPTSFELYDNIAGAVAGRVVADATGRVATFIPNKPLAVGRFFYVFLSQNNQSIRDLAGNALPGVTYSFTTGFASDTTPPTVSGYSPQNGDAGISVNAQVMIAFSKTIDEITATSGVTVVQNGTAVPGTWSFQNNDTQMIFTPTPVANVSAYLPGPVTVTTTQGLTDVAGNVITNVVSYTFTVDTVADTTRPSITLANPPNGVTGIGTNVLPQVDFSERINQLTVVPSSNFYVQDQNTSLYIPGTVKVSPNRRTAVFTPTSPFNTNTRYCWYVNDNGTNLTDLSGNPINGFGYCFTTGTGTDTTAPTVTQVTPPNGATGIPLNAVIIAQASKPLNSFTFQNLTGGYLAALTTGPGPQGGTAPADLGFFAGGTQIKLAVSGHGDLVNSNWQVNPDGTLFAAAASTYSYANAGATNYPKTSGGDGTNHFTGGGANVDQNGAFGFAGVQSTDTTAAGLIRLGTLVGTFVSQPAATDWFVIGFGTTVTVPAAGADLYLAVNDTYNPDNHGNYVVTYTTTPASALTPAMTLTNTTLNTNVPGVSTLSSDGLSMTFSPEVPLAASSNYKLNVQGVTDLVGNVITPFSSTFGTGTTSDTSQPIVLSYSPASGTKNVPVNSQLVVNFSKNIDPLTVNTSTMYVYDTQNGYQIGGTYTVDNSDVSNIGAVVTFTPSANMPAGAPIQLYVNYNCCVQDFSGNNAQNSSMTITTAGTSDTTPPTVISVTPTNGQTNLGLNTVVTLTFSKPLDQSTLNAGNFALFNGTTRLGTSVNYSSDHQSVSLSSSLPNNVTITVIATSGVHDLAGNALADFRSSFTTVQVTNTTRPSIVGQRPGNGATQIPAAAPVVLFANAPLNPSTVTSSSFIVSDNGVAVTGTISLSSNNQAIQFTPTAPFGAGDYVQIFMTTAVTDAQNPGNPLYNYAGAFTVAPSLAATAPVITQTVPYNGQTGIATNKTPIDIVFSKPLDPTTVNTTNFSLTLCQNGQVWPATVTLRTPQIVRITPTSNYLAPSQTQNNYYCYSASTAVKDTNGLNLVNALNNYFQPGTAADTVAPLVTQVTPPSGSSNIGTNAPIEVRFSKLMNTATISTSTVQITTLVNNVATPIAPMSIGFVTLSTGNTATTDVLFTPINVLPDNAVINIAISNAQDLAGNNVTPFTSSFTTRTGVDLVNANVISANPYSGSTAPTNTSVTLQFDKPVDPFTVNSGSIPMYDDVTGAQLAGAYSVGSNALSATFVPASPLAVGRSYHVYWGNSVHDLAGNYLNGGSLQFNSALTPSSTTPQILLTNPESTQTAVPINTQIQVEFNEPIQTLSISNVTVSQGNTQLTNVAATLSSGNTILTLTPPALLQGSTGYSITVAGIKDVAGNTLATPSPVTFTTAPGADLSGISVVGVNPPNGIRGVGTNITPTYIFSKRVDLVTLNSSTVYLYNNISGQVLSSTLVPSADRKSVVIQPASALLTNTQYCFYVYGLTDMIGNTVYQNNCFVTGLGPDTTPPVITQMDPPTTTTGVGINVRLQFYASKQINPNTFNAATAVALTTTNGSVAVAGTATLLSDLQTINFQPTANLSTSTGYTVKVNGFQDLLGNTLTPFTGTFTTSSNILPDTVQPTTLLTVPAAGATGVATSSTITLYYSKPLNPLTVNASNLYVYTTQTGFPVAGTWVLNNTPVKVGQTQTQANAVFTPVSPLPASSNIQVDLNYYAYVQDYVGNNLQGGSINFATAGTADTTPPTVTSVTPSNNATDQGYNTIVSLTFSKSLNPSTVNNNTFGMFAGPNRIGISIGLSSDYRTVTLNPSGLSASATITVTATTGVTDLAGNALVPSSVFPNLQSQFTTGAIGNTSRPSVVGQRPGNGATGVAPGSPVTLFLNQPMDPATTQPAMQVSANGALITGNAVLSGNNQVLTFTPATPFANGALVQVFLPTTALNSIGNPVNGYSGSFTVTPDLTKANPVVTGAIPSPNVQNVPLTPVIQITFSKALNANTLVTGSVPNVGLNANVNNQPVSINLSLAGPNSIVITPTSPLNPSVTYYYYVNTNVQDTNGLALTSQYTSYFTTGTTTDTTQPSVTTITPPTGSVGVGVNAEVYLHFSKPINPLTVSTGANGTIQLTANGNPVAPASISFTNLYNQGSNQDVRIIPYGTFPDNTAITVTATSGIQDPSGNALLTGAGSTSTFQTQVGALLNNTNAIDALPEEGTGGVPLNTALYVRTATPIDPTTLSSNTIQLYDNTAGGNAIALGTPSLSPDGMTISVAPAANLTASHSYRFYWNPAGNVYDINGDYLNGGSHGFSTSAAAITTPPTVISTNPPNGQTNVPINTQVQILFSEPIQVTTISGVTLKTGNTTLNMTPSFSNANQTLTLIPPALLAPNTSYTLTIAGPVDLAGNALATVTQTFTTGPLTVLVRPSATTVTPANNATAVSKTTTITVLLNAPMNPLTVFAGQGNFYVYVQNTGVVVPGTATLSADSLTATFTPTAALAASTQYQFYFYYATDEAGNQVNGFYSSFTTGP